MIKHIIRPLTPDEIHGSEFAHLLWLAVEVGDAELADIVAGGLTDLAIVGAVDNDHVVAFVAFDIASDPVVIEYIAVHERAQGLGYGSALVQAVRNAAPGRAISAQTDDDAVEFYRHLGFAIVAKDASDPRWPERQRYDCVLR